MIPKQWYVVMDSTQVGDKRWVSSGWERNSSSDGIATGKSTVSGTNVPGEVVQLSEGKVIGFLAICIFVS